MAAYTYGSSKPHAVTAAFGNMYGYDANGNQTSRTIGGVTYDLTFDEENRIVTVKQGATTIGSFVYDADGNRVKGTVNGVTTSYVAGLYEYQAGAVTKYYDGGAIRRTGYGSGNGISYVLGDQLGSTSVIVGQNGVAQATNYYYPFGGNRGGSAFSDLTTKRFTGQYHEKDLPGGEGLSYYNARWYDPQLGRFASADTILPRPGDPQAFNRYAYARNSPTVRIDPSGHGDCPVLSSPACKPPPDVIGPKPKPPKTPPQCGYFCNVPKWPIQKPPFIGPVKPPQPIIGKPPSLLPPAKTPAFVGPVASPSQNTKSSTGGSLPTTGQNKANTSSSMSISSVDYMSVSLTLPVGALGVIWDQSGNVYVNAGPGLGWGGALNIFGGTIDRTFGAPGGFIQGMTGSAYDPAVTDQEYLTGVSLNGGAGVILGGQAVWSPTAGFGGEVGASIGAYAGIGVQVPVFMITKHGVPIFLPTCDRSSCTTVLP